MITSTRMTVFPQKQYAQTEQPVRIDGAGGIDYGNESVFERKQDTPAIERKRTV
jgi:lipopolysaccharide export system protein LptC